MLTLTIAFEKFLIFQIASLPESLASCPRLKVLRFEENCISVTSIATKILTDSGVSLLAYQGNMFNEKDFQQVEGYEQVNATEFLFRTCSHKRDCIRAVD